MRLYVAKRFLAIYPEAGAEPFLRSVAIRIDKLKRLPLSTKDFKADKEGKQIDKGLNQISKVPHLL